MTSVSVIVPTYNRSSVLSRALRSILAQTRPANQIIVVDDGSTDGTADRITRGFPQIDLLQQENRGVSAARNRGILASRGEWIALLDSDDEWRPQKLERQLAELQGQPAYRVCHTDEIWIRRGRRVNPGRRHAKHGGWIFQRCLPLCAISPSTVLIHRTIFDEVGLFDEELPACEDYDLWLRICARYPVLLVEEPLVVKHGGHGDQLSRQIAAMDRFRIRAIERVLQNEALAEEDRRAAVQVLLDKMKIYIAGAEKRGRSEEVRSYRRRCRRWQEQISTGAPSS